MPHSKIVTYLWVLCLLEVVLMPAYYVLPRSVLAKFHVGSAPLPPKAVVVKRGVVCGAPPRRSARHRVRSPPPIAMSEELVKSIETPEEWLQICGEGFRRDMLFVVEVYASWCGPSQAANSTYRKIKDVHVDAQKKIKLCKVCADLQEQLEDPKAAAFDLEKYKINPRPTFALFKDGEQVAIVEGVSMPTLEKCAPLGMPLSGAAFHHRPPADVECPRAPQAHAVAPAAALPPLPV